MTASTSPNLYITRKSNNMDKAQALKKEWYDWTRLYYKMLKEIEAMIDVQRQVQNMMKIVEEANIMITEIEETILKVSINNQTMNTTNILEVSEDLWYLIQSNMEDQVFQIQRMLADELDVYKGRGNQYVENNIQEIQDLYKDEEHKMELKKRRVEEEEVILIRQYKILKSTSSTSLSITKLSFIKDEVDNLMKYMKFIQSPTQIRLFKLQPHYQALLSRRERDPDFWKEVATALVEEKHNTKTSRNKYPIIIFQGGLLYKPFFIAIDNQGLVTIGPNKKTVATYVVGKLEVLI